MKPRNLLSLPALCAALIAFGLAGCGDSNHDTTPSGSFVGTPITPESVEWTDPELGDRLARSLENWVEDYSLYGASARVFAPGRLDWTYATGLDDVENDIPYTVDTRGRVGSATKSFTATTILQLIDEGLLQLDSPLSDFVPDYPNAEEITVDHLLRHRSGIPEVQLQDLLFVLTVMFNPSRWFTGEEILRWTYGPIPMISIYTRERIPRAPVTEPGGTFHYSQPGYIALALIAEKVTGQPIQDLFAQRIIEPLGLTGTYLPRKDAPPGPVGYSNVFGLLPELIRNTELLPSENALTSVSLSAGGLISTARDLPTFLSAMLDGRLFSQAALSLATDWRFIEPGAIIEGDYGMGLILNQHDGFTTIGHDGAVPGGASINRYIPQLDVYIAAVTNTDKTYPPEGAPGLVERIRWALLDEK